MGGRNGGGVGKGRGWGGREGNFSDLTNFLQYFYVFPLRSLYLSISVSISVGLCLSICLPLPPSLPLTFYFLLHPLYSP